MKFAEREDVTVISLYYMTDKGQAPLICSIPWRLKDVKHTLIARDLEEQIRKRLNVKLKETYNLLLEGHILGEIAKRLKLTHEAVRRRVKKIRRMAKEFFCEKLGFLRTFFVCI